MASTHAILGLLSIQPMSGYEIRQSVEQHGMRFLWGLNYGSIYPALRQLQAGGLVTVSVQHQGRATLRKEYDITDRGRVELEQWLESPLSTPAQTDELFLRILFAPFGHATELSARLKERTVWLDEALKEIRTYTGPDVFHNELFRYGVEWFTLQRDWLERMQKLLAESEEVSDE